MIINRQKEVNHILLSVCRNVIQELIVTEMTYTQDLEDILKVSVHLLSFINLEL